MHAFERADGSLLRVAVELRYSDVDAGTTMNAKEIDEKASRTFRALEGDDVVLVIVSCRRFTSSGFLNEMPWTSPRVAVVPNKSTFHQCSCCPCD